MWIISIGSILTIVYGIYWINQPSHGTTTLESSFHESFHRVGWAISLSWIIFACINGYGGPVNWFLSLPVWQPFSRLSYSLYIVHLPIQLYMVSLTKTNTHFSDLNAVSMHLLYYLKTPENNCQCSFIDFGEILDFHYVPQYYGH